MDRIPSRTHGIIDYLVGGLLIALPRIVPLPRRISSVLTLVGVATLGTSLMTRYEAGLLKLIPFRVHLATDVAQALFFIAAPVVFADEDTNITTAMVGLGLSELAIVAMTDPETEED